MQGSDIETRAERLPVLHMYGGRTDRRLMGGEVILTHCIHTCMYLSAPSLQDQLRYNVLAALKIDLVLQRCTLKFDIDLLI